MHPVPSVDALPSSSAICLDKLLDAGLYTGEVTEIVGAPGSGKTQVHLQPAARRRVGGGGCIVLDLWGSFCQHPVISELRREKTSGKEGDLSSCLGAHLHLWDLDEIWWGYPILGPFWGLRFTQWPVSTQVCLCVAAHVAHGLQQNVLYIDSNGGLTASRILQLLQARTPDEEDGNSKNIWSFTRVQRLSSRIQQGPREQHKENLYCFSVTVSVSSHLNSQ